MPTRPVVQRRNQVLSRDEIIRTALDLLDAGGEKGLTIRILTERLSTGAGAIYYQVGNRNDLLDAVTETVVVAALAAAPDDRASTPDARVRVIALALFDAIAEHNWLATRLTLQVVRNPSGPTTSAIFERIGSQLGDLHVPRERWFDAASTIVHYILGAVSQSARIEGDTSGINPDADRDEFLDAAASAWEELAADDYPFLHAIGNQISHHDDRAQFLTGIDIVLHGLASLR